MNRIYFEVLYNNDIIYDEKYGMIYIICNQNNPCVAEDKVIDEISITRYRIRNMEDSMK